MPIFTLEGARYAAWDEAAQRKLKTYSLSECNSNLQLARSSRTTNSKQAKGQQETHTQSQPSTAPDATQELRKQATSKRDMALGPVGGFDVLSKHWESYLRELTPVQSDRRVTEFTSLFSHMSHHKWNATRLFIGSCMHSLLSGYTVVTSGLYEDKVLVESLTTLLRSNALNKLSHLALNTSEVEAKQEEFCAELEKTGVRLSTCDELPYTIKESTLESDLPYPIDSAYNPIAGITASGIDPDAHQVRKLLESQGLADTGVTEEYRFTTVDELNKKNHQPSIVVTINLGTGASLVSSLVGLLMTLFRTKHYQKELAERLRLFRQLEGVFLLPCASHSALQNIWQHLQVLAIEFIAQYLHLHNLNVSDLLQRENDVTDFQSDKAKTFESIQILCLIEFLPLILSKKTIKEKIGELTSVLPCVKLPRHVHIQLDCSGLSTQTLVTSTKQPSLTSLLTLMLAIPQVTVSIKQSSLSRLRVLSPADHSKFRIKYIRALSLYDTYSSTIAELNERVRNTIASMNENSLIQKAIKEKTMSGELQNESLFRALDLEGDSPKNVTDRNVAQIGIILNHLSVKSKARIALRHLLELQEQKMKINGHTLKSTELATDNDSVCIEELKESLLDTTQSKAAIILAGQTLESILAIFIDTESVLDGGIKKPGSGTKAPKARMESPLRRTQDCDIVGLYVVCTYTGIITLLDMMDAQN
ncbi:hypothetical protein GL50803_0014768 [Giardia duodenalis]|uniref:Uncharacterized protein n=1 Tax=Giardia intestinalis (strain ATCC 50803 / WB clone C6) TaxID=184922 RepID=A8BUG1_GIAIC|nr:hypothetical protein GL50803_0014768 [Giardia intestinalis]KAE8305482.1 hypothetical protein GL50803_0014768 [Giardia intestinalis]|eukprot:XP_001704772.1 Hypothetical protein GL50803_14768 [Giardia lamblia ATCC 50803]